MKKIISAVVTGILSLALIGLNPLAAHAAPADYAPWVNCATADEQYCVESVSLKLADGSVKTLSDLGMTFDAHFYGGTDFKAVSAGLLWRDSQLLPLDVVDATVSFSVRTGTWQPAKEAFGTGGYVSYSTKKTGANYSFSNSVKLVKYDSGDGCTPEVCEVQGTGAYPAYFATIVMPATPAATTDTFYSTSSASIVNGWDWATSSYSINFSQPKTLPTSMNALLTPARISAGIGATPAYIASKFKIELLQGNVAIGQASMKVTSEGLLVSASAPAGGAFVLKITPKVLLPKAVISSVNYISKTKQKVNFKTNKAAKSVFVTCYADGNSGKMVSFSSKTFSFTKSMPKGSWSCVGQYVNGYRGPGSIYFGLYNKG